MTGPAVERVDVLLLNASNYAGLPIYPYAFVQVTAVAGRHGRTVRRLDLLGTPKSEWPAVVGAAVLRSNPRMVGLHLRQADSLFVWDYAEADVPGAPTVVRNRYYPVDDTERLLRLVRSAVDVPVVIGGFGFTTHARRVLDRLRPDFGLLGEPDDFFARFDAVLAGRDLDAVANLAHRGADGWVLNRRVHFPPADRPEYTDELFAEIAEFYGEAGVSGAGAAHVPVELQRGCPHRCYFCTEPAIKGRRHRTRDLDVVMEDVRFLADRGAARVWLVCSEINIGGNELLFEVAGRMRELNAGRETPMGWSAYLLPNPGLSRAEIRELLHCGFEPAWNQFMSYDDLNLKDSTVPYRSRHALAAQLDWVLEEERFDAEQGRSARDRRLDMFLGNAYASGETIATTLERASAAGLPEHFRGALITRATRVFDVTGQSAGEDAFSLGPDGPLADVDLLHPTFRYPPALVAALGDRASVDEFFAYVEDTFLSIAYRTNRDWCRFLAEVTDADTFLGWCDELHDRLAAAPAGGLLARVLRETGEPAGRALVRRIFTPDSAHGAALDLLARTLAETVVSLRAAETRAAFALIGLPDYERPGLRLSAYDVGRALSARYRSVEELLADVRDHGYEPGSLPYVAVRLCLFGNDVRLRPAWAALLFRAG